MNTERVEAAAKALRELEGEKQTPWEELDYRIKTVWIGRARAALAAANAASGEDATITELREEVERLKGENEGLLKLDLHTLNVVKGRMDAMLGGNAVVRIMAMSYGEMFRNAGGENFCTQTLTDWSDEANPLTLEVTIRKYPDGKTPEVVMGEMRAELTQLREDRGVLANECEAWRLASGNKPEDVGDRWKALYVIGGEWRWRPLPAADATDASGALERSNG